MKISLLVKQIESDYLKFNAPNYTIGSTVCINVLIQEGNKKRIQPYVGKIYSKHCANLNSTITVRRISKGIYIDRIFPVHSPDIKSIELIEK